MARKQVIMVVSFEDDETSSSYDTAGSVAQTFQGCVEDMEGSSFPDLEIKSFESVADLVAAHGTTGNFLPIQEAPKFKGR
jgi:hypothetical protein